MAPVPARARPAARPGGARAVQALALGGALVVAGQVGLGLAQEIVPGAPADAGLGAGVPATTAEIDPLDASDVFSERPVPERQTARETVLAQPGLPGEDEEETPEILPPGPSATLDVSTGLRIEDEGLVNRNSLGLTFLTQTREQRLELELGTTIDVQPDGGLDEDFLPDVDLRYLRDTGVLQFSFAGSYAASDVNGSIPGPNFFFDETDVIRDDGTRETTRMAASLEIGRRDPIGLELGASFQERNFSDTEDPDLSDASNAAAEAALRFDLSRRLTFRLTASRVDVEDGGDILDSDQTETAYGGRLTWQATPRTRVDASLARARTETERNETVEITSTVTGLFVERIPTGRREFEELDGLEGELSVRHRMPNGTLEASLERELTGNGDIDRVALARRLSLADGSDLRLQLGAARFEGSDTVPTFDLRYTRLLKAGLFETSLQRGVAVDSDDQNVTRTRLNVTHVLPVTPISDLTTTLGVVEIGVVDGFEPDQIGADLAVTYSRAIGQSWSMDVGYEGFLSRDEGDASNTENILFVNLRRSFDLRP